MISKSIKIKISLSIMWGIFTLICSIVVANEESFGVFIGTFLAVSFPLIVYWLGFWIWGDGYIFKVVKSLFGKKTLAGVLTVLVFVIVLGITNAVEEGLYKNYDKSSARSFANTSAFVNLIGFMLAFFLSYKTWNYFFKKNESSVEPPNSHSLNEQKKWKSFLLLNDPEGKHPWRRYFARMLDYILWATVFYVLLDIFKVEFVNDPNSDLVGSLLAIMTWIPIEAFMLWGFGTTPGKWLIGIKVKDSSGKNLVPKISFKRALEVWVVGTGFGLPIVSLFTMSSSHQKLVNQGSTSWDQKYGSNVEFGKYRYVSLVLVLTIYSGLIYLGNRVSEQENISIAVEKQNFQQYPEKRSEILAAYMNNVAPLVGGMLEPESLLDPNRVSDSRNILLKCSDYIHEAQRDIDQTFVDGREAINSLPVDVVKKAELLKNYEEQKSESLKALNSFFETEREIMKVANQIMNFAQENKESIVVDKGQLLFETDSQVDTYNLYINKLSELIAEEGRFIQKLNTAAKQPEGE